MNNTRHFKAKLSSGKFVWVAQHRTINQKHVAEVVSKYIGSERSLTIYSGVHGDMEGKFDYPERSFGYEDRKNAPDNVTVINVSRKKINPTNVIATSKTDVLFAWCFSDMSAGGKSPYKDK